MSNHLPSFYNFQKEQQGRLREKKITSMDIKIWQDQASFKVTQENSGRIKDQIQAPQFSTYNTNCKSDLTYYFWYKQKYSEVILQRIKINSGSIFTKRGKCNYLYHTDQDARWSVKHWSDLFKVRQQVCSRSLPSTLQSTGMLLNPTLIWKSKLME